MPAVINASEPRGISVVDSPPLRPARPKEVAEDDFLAALRRSHEQDVHLLDETLRSSFGYRRASGLSKSLDVDGRPPWRGGGSTTSHVRNSSSSPIPRKESSDGFQFNPDSRAMRSRAESPTIPPLSMQRSKSTDALSLSRVGRPRDLSKHTPDYMSPVRQSLGASSTLGANRSPLPPKPASRSTGSASNKLTKPLANYQTNSRQSSPAVSERNFLQENIAMVRNKSRDSLKAKELRRSRQSLRDSTEDLKLNLFNEQLRSSHELRRVVHEHSASTSSSANDLRYPGMTCAREIQGGQAMHLTIDYFLGRDFEAGGSGSGSSGFGSSGSGGYTNSRIKNDPFIALVPAKSAVASAPAVAAQALSICHLKAQVSGQKELPILRNLEGEFELRMYSNLSGKGKLLCRPVPVRILGRAPTAPHAIEVVDEHSTGFVATWQHANADAVGSYEVRLRPVSHRAKQKLNKSKFNSKSMDANKSSLRNDSRGRVKDFSKCKSELDLPVVVSVGKDHTRLTITDLPTDSFFEVSVRAVGSGPCARASSWSRAEILARTMTTQATIPRAPGQPTVVSFDSSAITLEWKAPADTGGADISHYELRIYRNETPQAEVWPGRPTKNRSRDDATASSTDQVSWPATTSDATARFILRAASGSPATSSYFVKVRAVNSIGPSEYSILSPILRMQPGAPSAPMVPSFSSAEGSRALVTWKGSGFDGGSPIQKYELECKISSDQRNSLEHGSFSRCVPSTLQSMKGGYLFVPFFLESYLLENVPQQGCYVTRVRAVSDSGFSSWSPWSKPSGVIKSSSSAVHSEPSLASTLQDTMQSMDTVIIPASTETEGYAIKSNFSMSSRPQFPDPTPDTSDADMNSSRSIPSKRIPMLGSNAASSSTNRKGDDWFSGNANEVMPPTDLSGEWLDESHTSYVLRWKRPCPDFGLVRYIIRCDTGGHPSTLSSKRDEHRLVVPIKFGVEHSFRVAAVYRGGVRSTYTTPLQVEGPKVIDAETTTEDVEDGQCCPPPSNIRVVDITRTSAVLHWTAPPGVTVLAYGLHVFQTSNQGEGQHGRDLVNEMELKADSTGVEVSGLFPASGYQFGLCVRSTCGESDQIFSQVFATDEDNI